MLRIKNLVKTYGDKTAIDNLSIEINPGEVYGFIGHNGAGKTTTIKACIGILQTDSGEIYIDGKDLNSVLLHLCSFYLNVFAVFLYALLL